jgi:hypothetical protein
MNRPNPLLAFVGRLWHKLAMPIFVERFVLPVLAAVLILVLGSAHKEFQLERMEQLETWRC